MTKREGGNRFRYDFSPPVNYRGFSGAPILDSKGYLVGVMTVWFKAKKVGDKHQEAGGEDATLIVPIIAGKR